MKNIIFLFLYISIHAAIFSEDASENLLNKKEKSESLADKTAAVVNGEIITWNELKNEVLTERLLNNLDPVNYPDSVLKDKLNDMIDRRLLLRAAVKEEIHIPEEKIDAEVNDIVSGLRARLSSENNLRESLEKSGLNIEKLKTIAAEKIKTDFLIKEYISKNIFVEKPEEDAYKIRLSSQNKPLERYLVSHILLKTEPEDSQAKILEKTGICMQIINEFNNVKTDFAILAEKYSDDAATKNIGGDLGILNKGEIEPAIESALLKLKIGEVSEPVKTSGGMHVFLLRDRQTPREMLIAEKFDAEMKKRLTMLKSKAVIKIALNNMEQ